MQQASVLSKVQCKPFTVNGQRIGLLPENELISFEGASTYDVRNVGEWVGQNVTVLLLCFVSCTVVIGRGYKNVTKFVDVIN